MIGRITQRVLAELKRDSRAEEVFQRLIQKNGRVPVTQSARNDIGIRGNPIWESLYYRIPVNSDAKKILTAYSERYTDSE